MPEVITGDSGDAVNSGNGNMQSIRECFGRQSLSVNQKLCQIDCFFCCWQNHDTDDDFQSLFRPWLNQTVVCPLFGPLERSVFVKQTKLSRPLNQLRTQMRHRHYSPSIEAAYLHWVKFLFTGMDMARREAHAKPATRTAARTDALLNQELSPHIQQA